MGRWVVVGACAVTLLATCAGPPSSRGPASDGPPIAPPTAPVSDAGVGGELGDAGTPRGDAGSPSAPTTVGEVLATDDAPDSLALDAQNLYWVDRNPYCLDPTKPPCDLRIRALAKSGGAVRTLATVTAHSFALEVDAQFVYFAGVVGHEACGRPTCNPVWRLYRVAKQGGPVEELAGGLGTIDQLSVGGDAVYLAGAPDGQPWSAYGIVSVPKPGGPAQLLVPGQQTTDVLFADGHLYWSADDGVRRIGPNGSAAEQLFTVPRLFPGRLRLDGSTLDFLAQGSLMAAPASGGAPRLVRAGSASTPVSSFDVSRGELFFTQGGCVGRVLPDGSAHCIDQVAVDAREVRLDDGAVFCLEGRRIIRLPR
jgi:hypothetical protein